MQRGWYAFWSVLLGVFLMLGSVFAAGEVSHPAEQIKPGVFGGDFGGGNFSFNGSVGVGVGSPAYTLDVNGSVRFVYGTGVYGGFVRISNDNLISDFSFDGGDDKNFWFSHVSNGSGYVSFVWLNESNPLDKRYLLFMKDTGQIGVGTDIPSFSLDVVGGFRVTSAGKTSLFSDPTSGYVGVGTGLPAALLHVTSGSSGDAVLILEADTDNNNEDDNPRILFKHDGGISHVKAGFIDGVNNGNNFGFLYYDSALGVFDYPLLVLDTINKTVGIGTTTPQDKLTVIDGYLRIDSPGLGWGTHQRIVSKGPLSFMPDIDLTGDPFIYFLNGSASPTILIDPQNIKLGIGTMSPSYTLDVNGSINGQQMCIAGSCRSSWPDAADVSGWNDTGGVVELVTSSDNVSAGVLFVDNVNGRVGINTSVPSFLLDVNGSEAGPPAVRFVGGVQFEAGEFDIYAHPSGATFIDLYLKNTSLGKLDYWRILTGDYIDGSTPDLQFVQFVGGSGFSRFKITPEGDVEVPSGNLTVPSGRVGIGTSLPGVSLDVLGDVRVNFSFNSTVLTLEKHAFYAPMLSFDSWSSEAPYVQFKHNGTRYVYVKAGSDHGASPLVQFVAENGAAFSFLGGRVGVGTSSPVYSLDVKGDVFLGDLFFVNSSSGSVGLGVPFGSSSFSLLYLRDDPGIFQHGLYVYFTNTSRTAGTYGVRSTTYVGGTAYAVYGEAYSGVDSAYGVYGRATVGGSGSAWGVYCSAANCGGSVAWTTTSDVRVKEGVSVLVPVGVNGSVKLDVFAGGSSLGGLLSGLAVGVPVGVDSSVGSGSSLVGNVSVRQVDVLSKIRRVRPLVYRKDLVRLGELKLLNGLYARARENASLRRLLEERGVWDRLVKYEREEWDPDWARVLLGDDEVVRLLNVSGVLPAGELDDLVWQVRHAGRGVSGGVDVEVGFAAQDLKDVFPEVVVWDNATGTYGITYSELIPYLFLAVQELDAKVSSGSGSQSVLGGNVSFALRAENATRAAVADFAKNASHAFEADLARNADMLSGYRLEDITSLIDYAPRVKPISSMARNATHILIVTANETHIKPRLINPTANTTLPLPSLPRFNATSLSTALSPPTISLTNTSGTFIYELTNTTWRLIWKE